MTTELKRIHVGSDTTLAGVLDEAESQPVLLERDGALYRLSREISSVGSGYTPERLIATLDELAGSINREQAERMKEYIYRAREDGTRRDDPWQRT